MDWQSNYSRVGKGVYSMVSTCGAITQYKQGRSTQKFGISSTGFDAISDVNRVLPPFPWSSLEVR